MIVKAPRAKPANPTAPKAPKNPVAAPKQPAGKPAAASNPPAPKEPLFTGQRRDSAGRTMCFQQGVRVPCGRDKDKPKSPKVATLEKNHQRNVKRLAAANEKTRAQQAKTRSAVDALKSAKGTKKEPGAKLRADREIAKLRKANETLDKAKKDTQAGAKALQEAGTIPGKTAARPTEKPAKEPATPNAKPGDVNAIQGVRLKTPLHSKALHNWVSGSNAESRMGTFGDKDSLNHDPMMKDINKELGYDKPAHTCSKEEMDKFVVDGEIEIYRGLTSNQFASQYKGGDLFTGLGVYGNGTYCAMAASKHDPEFGLDTARSYAMSKNGKGAVMRMTLKKGSVIKTHKELVQEQRRDVADLIQRHDQEKNPEKKKKLGRLCEAISDVGRYASLKGVDAIHVENMEYMVILNRSASRVQKENI